MGLPPHTDVSLGEKRATNNGTNGKRGQTVPYTASFSFQLRPNAGFTYGQLLLASTSLPDLTRPLAHLRVGSRCAETDGKACRYEIAPVHTSLSKVALKRALACILELMTASTKQPLSFNILGLDHVVLRVRDMKHSLHFYCDILGCSVERTVDSLGLVQLRAGTSLIDLVKVESELGRKGGRAPDTEGHNVDHFCIRIEPFSPDQLKSDLSAQGIEIGEVSRRYGADGYGPSLYISDPDGNTVELKGPPEDVSP